MMRQSILLCSTMAGALCLASCGPSEQKPPADRSSRSASEPASCYAMVKLESFAREPDRKIFVFVDQTTVFDDHLKRKISDGIKDFLGDQGGAFEIAKFSAFTKGSYASSVGEGFLETYNVDKSEEASQSVRSLEKLNECLKQQRPFVLGKARDAVDEVVSLEEGDFSNSEVLASLVRFSRLVRESSTKEKVIIIASDMLEHSQATSFYKDKGIRVVDPQKELAHARELDLIGDFGGAKVYVIGGGLLSPSAGREAGRDPEALKQLTDFWSQWVEASNGKLIEFGAPDLMSTLTPQGQ
jgi:hypothetical protein